MIKGLIIYFFGFWFIWLLFLTLVVTFCVLYYPVHSWLFLDAWAWDSWERSLLFYKTSIPTSLFIAVILTINQWHEMRKEKKKTDEPSID